MTAGPRTGDAPLDEATCFAESRAAKTCSRIVFALVILYTLLVLHVFMGRVPHFKKMFMEMGTDLPGLTILALFAAPVAAPLVFLAAIGSTVKEFVLANRPTTLIINGVHLVVLVAAKEIVQLSLGLPLLRLMESLG